MKNNIRRRTTFFSFLFRIAVVILFLLIKSGAVSAKVADTWAAKPKYLGGDFETPGGNWSFYSMPDSTIDGRWYKDLWLVPGAEFEFKFYFHDNGETQWEPSFNTSTGNRVLQVPDTTVSLLILDYNWADTPSAPTGLSYYAGPNSIHLSWSPPPDNSKYDVIYGGYYEIYYETGPTFTNWNLYDTVPGDVDSATITGLTDGVTYYFTVTAVDAYNDTTGPLRSDYAESIAGVPKPYVNVHFRIFVGGMEDSAVYIGYVDTEDVWRETLLQKEDTTGWWGGTVPLPAAFNLAFKFVIEDSVGNKTYEYGNSSGMYYHFLFPAADTVSQVQVQGSWDGWSTKTAMELRFDSYWHGDVYINNGLYEYKFILNGSEYVFDPLNPLRRNNNSLLSVDCLPTSSEIRELTVPDTDSTYSYDWEDTPSIIPYFQAYSYSETAAYLVWKPILAEDIDTILIEFTQTPNDPTSWSTLAQLASDVDTYIQWGCVVNDTYYYRIKAIDYGGHESEYYDVNYTVIKPQIPVIIYTDRRNWLQPFSYLRSYGLEFSNGFRFNFCNGEGSTLYAGGDS